MSSNITTLEKIKKKNHTHLGGSKLTPDPASFSLIFTQEKVPAPSEILLLLPNLQFSFNPLNLTHNKALCANTFMSWRHSCKGLQDLGAGIDFKMQGPIL